MYESLSENLSTHKNCKQLSKHSLKDINLNPAISRNFGFPILATITVRGRYQTSNDALSEFYEVEFAIFVAGFTVSVA